MDIKGDWGYVANPRGDFNGFWWHWKKDESSQQYFQLEHEKLYFKIRVDDKDMRTNLKSQWCKRMLDNCNEYDLAFKYQKGLETGDT